MAIITQVPTLNPAVFTSQSHITDPSLPAVLASNFFTTLPLVKLIEQVAPGVVIHTDCSLVGAPEPLKLGLWLLTKVPYGATRGALVPLLVAVPDFGLSSAGSIPEAVSLPELLLFTGDMLAGPELLGIVPEITFLL